MPGCGGEAQHGVQEEQAERCWPQELQAAALLHPIFTPLVARDKSSQQLLSHYQPLQSRVCCLRV